MKGYFVYMFLDEDEEVLYIGSSIHLVKRIESQHFLSQHGNLSEECLLETYKVLYHQGVSESDMKVKERYLINTLAPQYNDKMNRNDKFAFEIPDITWKLYSLDIEGLIEKRENSSDKKYKIGLKNYKIDFLKNYNLTINSTNDLWVLYPNNFYNEDGYPERDYNTGYGYYYDFHLILINKEIYIYCKEIEDNFGDSKTVSHLNDFDVQYFYEGINSLKEKFGNDSFALIESKCKSGIFEKYYYHGGVGEQNFINARNKLFMKYDLLKSQKLVHEDWILRIDWIIKNHKVKGIIDWVKMIVYNEYDWEIEEYRLRTNLFS